MALFFLTYDLRKQRDYSKLYEELHRFNAVKVLESTWCFNRINTNAAGLRDHFKQFVDGDDGVIVNESSDWASFRVNGTPRDLA